MRGDELRAVQTYMLRLRKRARGTSDRLVFELLAERDRMRHGLVQPLDIELVLPPADDDSSNAIADQIRQGTAFAHEFVDAKQNGERLDRDVGDDRERRRERHEARAGHTRGTLRRD